MRKVIGILLIFLVTISFLHAQSPAQEAQDRAKAYRAAKMDAMRQLAETIKGVRISAQTNVKDFVTEKDEIRASMETFLQGAQQIGEPRYNADGTVEVDMQVSLDQLILWLQQSWYQHGSNRIASSNEIQGMRYNSSTKIFKATGSGAMRQAPSSGVHGNVWNQVTPRGKLMALRTARVDAYRNLAEAIQGIRITASTTVKDFVAESDEIRSAFNGIVRGAEFVGRPRYRPEGVVEVTAQVDLYQLASSLSQICGKHHGGARWTPNDFQNIKQRFSERYVHAVGTGVPPGKYMMAESPAPGTFEPQPSVIPPAPPVPPQPYVPEWAKKTVSVTGTGAIAQNDINPGQAKLKAIRAAQLDGYRQLSEQVMGLRLDAKTVVRDFVTESDEIRTRVSTYLRGARITDTRIVGDGTAEVNMSLYLGDIWRLIEAHYRRR